MTSPGWTSNGIFRVPASNCLSALAAGGHVLSGRCFYQSYAREIAEANGWKRLATNSAKMVNILGGYGYVPLLASMEQCVEAAEKGRLA